MHHPEKHPVPGRVLLHTCCGPCLTHPFDSLTAEGFKVACLYFNPNIHPHQEHLRRLEQVARYCAYVGCELSVGEYAPATYFRAVAYHEAKPERCRQCYTMRLEESAARARRFGFEAFTTTMLVSPYQEHDAIRQAGELAGVRHGVPFLYRDFREGYARGVEQSRQLGMYRQKYCGCLYSELERFEERRSGGKGHRGGPTR